MSLRQKLKKNLKLSFSELFGCEVGRMGRLTKQPLTKAQEEKAYD